MLGIGIGITKRRFQSGDIFSDAEGLYSLRELGTEPNAIRVRRASDNAEANIGFSSGDLNTTVLTAFCSGTDGFVTTWYDQSGNGYHLTQTSLAYQPKIYDTVSGVLSFNGKPAMLYDGVDDYLQNSTLGSVMNGEDTDLSVFINLQKSSTAWDQVWEMDHATNAAVYIYNAMNGSSKLESLKRSSIQAVVGSTLNYSANTPYIHQVLYSGVNAYSYLNNVNYITAILNVPAFSGAYELSYFTLGAKFRASTPGDQFGGYFNECIIYPSYKEGSRGDILSNLNTYYSVY